MRADSQETAVDGQGIAACTFGMGSDTSGMAADCREMTIYTWETGADVQEMIIHSRGMAPDT